MQEPQVLDLLLNQRKENWLTPKVGPKAKLTEAFPIHTMAKVDAIPSGYYPMSLHGN